MEVIVPVNFFGRELAVELKIKRAERPEPWLIQSNSPGCGGDKCRNCLFFKHLSGSFWLDFTRSRL
jgi:hypothetical protein